MSDRETPCGPISWVFDKPALRQLVAAVQSSSEVVMDLETTAGRRTEACRHASSSPA